MRDGTKPLDVRALVRQAMESTAPEHDAARRRVDAQRSVASGRDGATEAPDRNDPVRPGVDIDQFRSVEDLLALDDREFVHAAYRILLRRPPDAAGLRDRVDSLRDGTPRRVVLARIRWSAEGRQKGVRFEGLGRCLVAGVLSHFRLLGYPVETAIRIFQLPTGARRIRQLESASRDRRAEIEAVAAGLQDAIGRVAARVEDVDAQVARGADLLRDELLARVERESQQHSDQHASVREALAAAIREFDAKLATLAQASGLSELVSRVDAVERSVGARLDLLDERMHSAGAAERSTLERVVQLEARLDEMGQGMRPVVESLPGRVEAVEGRVDQLNERVRPALERLPDEAPDTLVLEAPAYLAKAIDAAGIPVEEYGRWSKDEFMYHLFEAVFYRSEVVKQKQKIYLEALEGAARRNPGPIIDLGCGRGELLTHLRSLDIAAVGVERSKLLVDRAAERGLEIVHADALQYLEDLEGSPCAVTALQVIEHLEPAALERLVTRVHEVLAPGGLILLETVNPKCPLAFSNFFVDPTHVRPVPPELIVYLLQWNGFVDARIVYSMPIPSALRTPDPASAYQDYAVVANKGG